MGAERVATAAVDMEAMEATEAGRIKDMDRIKDMVRFLNQKKI